MCDYILTAYETHASSLPFETPKSRKYSEVQLCTIILHLIRLEINKVLREHFPTVCRQFRRERGERQKKTQFPTHYNPHWNTIGRSKLPIYPAPVSIADGLGLTSSIAVVLCARNQPHMYVRATYDATSLKIIL